MNNQKEIYKITLEPALKKIEKNMEALRDPFPFVTITGEWDLCKDEDWDLNIFNNGYWCNSFWISKLGQACKVTKIIDLKRKADELDKLTIIKVFYYMAVLINRKNLPLMQFDFGRLPQFWGID